ncbi:MAG: hypothetical protein U1E92_07215 [Moraxella osloensis]
MDLLLGFLFALLFTLLFDLSSALLSVVLFAFLSGFLADFLPVAVVDDKAFCAFCFTVLSLAADFLLALAAFSEGFLSPLVIKLAFLLSVLALFLELGLESRLESLPKSGLVVFLRSLLGCFVSDFFVSCAF